MHRRPNRIARLTGWLLLAGAGCAVAATDAPAPVNRYAVELIVFRHLDQDRNTAEIPAASSLFRASPLNLTLEDLPLAPPTAPVPIEPAVPTPPARRAPLGFHLLSLDPVYPDFVPLRADALNLTPVYARLQRIDAYEPLAHIGWVQPARTTGEARPYRFDAGAGAHPGLGGSVTLYKERFVHLEVDLTLAVAAPLFDVAQPSPGQPFTERRFPGPTVADAPGACKLTESRRIRGATAHYFDHPRFGVIALVTEIVRPAARGRAATVNR